MLRYGPLKPIPLAVKGLAVLGGIITRYNLMYGRSVLSKTGSSGLTGPRSRKDVSEKKGKALLLLLASRTNLICLCFGRQFTNLYPIAINVSGVFP